MNPYESELISINKKALQKQDPSWFMCMKAYEDMRLSIDVTFESENDLFYMREKMDSLC